MKAVTATSRAEARRALRAQRNRQMDQGSASAAKVRHMTIRYAKRAEEAKP